MKNIGEKDVKGIYDMKKSISVLSIILMICTVNSAYPQAYDGSFYGFFFGRQPSARAEAMGRSLASVPGDVSSCYFNPAGLASLPGLNLWGNYAEPYYEFENGNFVGFGATYSIKKLGVVGFSGEAFTPNEYAGIHVNDTGSAGKDAYNTGVPNVRISVSSKIAGDFLLGASINAFIPFEEYRNMSIGNEKGVSDNMIAYLDLGIMKSYSFLSGRKKHTFNLGSSLINTNFAGYTLSDGIQKAALPVIFRFGASYKLDLYSKANIIYPKFTFLTNIEYEDVLNSQFYGGYHAGFEFGLFGILFLRTGYYSQKNRECINCSDRLSEFTYGAGINLNFVPSYKKFWGLKLDYANLRQPSLTTDNDDPGRFNVYTAQLYFVF